MIRYFIDRQELTHVREICELLNRLKIRIMRDDYSDPRLEFNDCKKNLIIYEILPCLRIVKSLLMLNLSFVSIFCYSQICQSSLICLVSDIMNNPGINFKIV